MKLCSRPRFGYSPSSSLLTANESSRLVSWQTYLLHQRISLTSTNLASRNIASSSTSRPRTTASSFQPLSRYTNWTLPRLRTFSRRRGSSYSQESTFKSRTTIWMASVSLRSLVRSAQISRITNARGSSTKPSNARARSSERPLKQITARRINQQRLKSRRCTMRWIWRRFTEGMRMRKWVRSERRSIRLMRAMG